LKPHITAIPQGTRTFLFEEAELKRRIEQEIYARLRERGFQEIVTPLLEYYDSAAVALGGEAGRIIRFAEEESGMAMALRADITSQVARSAATHLGKMPLPLKLCYNGPVFRRAQKGKGEQYVLNQSGMEIIGEPAPEGDARIVEAIMACMNAVGLKSYTFSVGHAGVIGSFLSLNNPLYSNAVSNYPDVQELLKESQKTDNLLTNAFNEGSESYPQLHNLAFDMQRELFELAFAKMEKIIWSAISKKDKGALMEALKQTNYPKRLSNKIVELAMLCGDITVLDDAKKVCHGMDNAMAAIQNLEEFIKAVGSEEFNKRLVIDFGETRGRGYYTGVIMEIFSDSMPALGAGGRYDNLVGRFGRDLPAVGFAFDVERLMEAVTRQNARSRREG